MNNEDYNLMNNADIFAPTISYSHGFGESVVDADFSGKSANFGFLEVTLQLPTM